MRIRYSTENEFTAEELAALFASVGWASAKRPGELVRAMRNSHRVVSARIDGKTVGLANSISDGCMAAYVPYVLVHRDWQGRGIGRELVTRLLAEYVDFPRVALISYADAAGFYERCGLHRGDGKLPMFAGELPS